MIGSQAITCVIFPQDLEILFNQITNFQRVSLELQNQAKPDKIVEVLQSFQCERFPFQLLD